MRGHHGWCDAGTAGVNNPVCCIRLFVVTFGMTNSMTYYFTDAVTEAFVNKRADVYNPDSSFKEIDGIDEWYTVST